MISFSRGVGADPDPLVKIHSAIVLLAGNCELFVLEFRVLSIEFLRNLVPDGI